MYHSRWKGLPYDAGLRYGALVLKNAGPLEPPFPLSEERRAFAFRSDEGAFFWA